MNSNIVASNQNRMEVCGDDEKQGMAYCRYYRNCTYDNRVLLHYTEKYTHRIYKRKNNLDKWGDKMSQVENKTIYNHILCFSTPEQDNNHFPTFY